jgi:hypothetical protein
MLKFLDNYVLVAAESDKNEGFRAIDSLTLESTFQFQQGILCSEYCGCE